MREICIDDFLMKCNLNHVERHSDSSDFESPRKIPIIASKGGNHRLLSGRTCNTKHETRSPNNHFNKTPVKYDTKATNSNKIKTPEIRTQQKNTSVNMKNRVTNEETKDNLYRKLTLNNSNKNRGDQSNAYYSENVNSKSLIRNKAMPCLSSIFRRRANCTKHMSSIQEDQANVAIDCGRACCSNCERRRVKRPHKHRRGFSVQPVYNVEENIRGFPFPTNKDKAELNEMQKNNGTDVSNELNPSSKSELEDNNSYKRKKFLKRKKKSLEDNMQRLPLITNNEKDKLPELIEILQNNGTDLSNDQNLSSKSDLENVTPYKPKMFLKKMRKNVEKDIQRLPVITNNDEAQLPEFTEVKNNGTNVCNDLNSSSKSELENYKPYKHKAFLKKMKKIYEKEKVIDYLKYDPVKNYQQQYPSKFQMNPYQVFSTSSCQAKCSACESESFPKMPSSSSSSTFWDFFARKMKNKIQKPGVSKSCDCIRPPDVCSPENCQNFKSHPENNDYYNTDQRTQENQYSSQSSTNSKKKNKEPKVICKCYSNKKKSNRSKNDTKPCQEDHDEITKAIADKYNGEILCIHNPPCILINGCLNLPPPKVNVQGNLWPVTQSKKSSFVQMCRKIKRSKQKCYEQASQYHPPYVDVQEFLPEFKTEKHIQSICNHEPPCEVVHGCYKVQYDPKLQNSCVHVPMCQYLPVCLMSEKRKDVPTGSCSHHPKCTKLPMCSRKYITLTAKEHVGTQVKPKAKIACRHQPPCFMIPKCLAQAISGNYIPYGAVPGCVHKPCCEMIPACCRKSAKEMVSVPSQYPNACRIV